MGSVLYVLFNGWYLGQWADYSSCLRDATNSQYVLADIQGIYKGDVEFTRGGYGKFSPNLSTRIGLRSGGGCGDAAAARATAGPASICGGSGHFGGLAE